MELLEGNTEHIHNFVMGKKTGFNERSPERKGLTGRTALRTCMLQSEKARHRVGGDICNVYIPQ